MSHEMPLMQEYIGQAAATQFKLVKSNSSQIGDIPSQQIRLLIEENDVETSAFAKARDLSTCWISWIWVSLVIRLNHFLILSYFRVSVRANTRLTD